MAEDWLETMLDRYPETPVSAGFGDEVGARVAQERPSAFAKVLRGADGSAGPESWARRFLGGAAAALLLLGAGYWMGQGAPSLHLPPSVIEGPAVAQVELDAIFADRALLEAWDLVSDDALELALTDEAAGTWILDQAEGEE